MSVWKKPTMRSLLFDDFADYPTRMYEFDSFLPFRFIKKSFMKGIIKKAEKNHQKQRDEELPVISGDVYDNKTQ